MPRTQDISFEQLKAWNELKVKIKRKYAKK